MRNYMTEFVEWMAQRLVVKATTRAAEMLQDFERGTETPQALTAPRLPQIQLISAEVDPEPAETPARAVKTRR